MYRPSNSSYTDDGVQFYVKHMALSLNGRSTALKMPKVWVRVPRALLTNDETITYLKNRIVSLPCRLFWLYGVTGTFISLKDMI